MDDGPGPAITVEIADHQIHLPIDAAALAALTRRALRGEGVARATISIALVDDATIHDLNRRHLGHDWPTDVITFRLSGPDEAELAAELVLSAEMAATTAREAGVHPGDELTLYLVHGLLHLCGFDDTSAEAAAAMRRREAEVLAREGRPNTFAAAMEAEPCRA
jgi:probable rRNA maturation factor